MANEIFSVSLMVGSNSCRALCAGLSVKARVSRY